MTKTVDAIFENGVFRPKTPVDLEEKSEVRLVIQPTRKLDDAVKLLNLWLAGDKNEQRETWDYLKQSLDEDRPSSRKLFSN
jgi:predicted DNA-binding antitoxin AbrB/MazE fold protein